jgi:hypothetical protein
MIFIYVIELQEEAPMYKKHWKRETKKYAGSTILIYTTSCREVKGREIVRKEIKKERSKA